MGAWPGMNLFKGNKAKSIEAKFVQQTSLKAVANHGGARVCRMSGKSNSSGSRPNGGQKHLVLEVRNSSWTFQNWLSKKIPIEKRCVCVVGRHAEIFLCLLDSLCPSMRLSRHDFSQQGATGWRRQVWHQLFAPQGRQQARRDVQGISQHKRRFAEDPAQSSFENAHMESTDCSSRTLDGASSVTYGSTSTMTCRGSSPAH